jgi:hypothetical protein
VGVSRDLTVFTDDNDRWRNQRKRVPWEERAELIREHFPAVTNPEWNAILRDPDVLARLLRDILKIDQIEPGRAGPRPGLDFDRGMQSWKEFTGQDYCELPFAQAFRLIAYGQSIRQIAHKTGVARSRVDRLLRGEDLPTIGDLRVIASAYNKKPAFFAEYRVEYIIAAISARLSTERDMSAAIYARLVRAS